MVASRPFAGVDELQAKGSAIWRGLDKQDWLEAFAGHPKIGQNLNELRRRFAKTADWSAGEQSAVAQASEAVLARLAEGNELYEKKFGYIFIVCATGKTAEEMLELLHKRLPNEPTVELTVAAGQQELITAIRLGKLCQ